MTIEQKEKLNLLKNIEEGRELINKSAKGGLHRYRFDLDVSEVLSLFNLLSKVAKDEDFYLPGYIESIPTKMKPIKFSPKKATSMDIARMKKSIQTNKKLEDAASRMITEGKEVLPTPLSVEAKTSFRSAKKWIEEGNLDKIQNLFNNNTKGDEK